MSLDHDRYLRRAIELSATTAPGNPPFGSLLVGQDGQILAEDRNTTHSDNDITAHPELKLARWAARELDWQTAAQTTMYTSCQPCAMCLTAIERSGLGHVVYALSSEQLADLREAPPLADVKLTGPALLDEARVPIERFFGG